MDTKGGVSFNDLLARSVLHLAIEATSVRNYDFLYGGWFEIASLDEELTFEKIEYGIKFWHQNADGSIRLDLPTIYSSYVNDDLVLTSLFNNKRGGVDVVVNQIDDLLGRQPTVPNRIPAWSPRYLFHIVTHAEGKKIRFFWESDEQSFWWVISESGAERFEVKPPFLDLLISGSKGEYEELDISKEFH
jgi:hypothetical protein